ncbi:FMN-dependent NADH-azoreductase [Halopseudomonas laoshanensis]|uniref:FMN dependent NADH:quinone oxidoreductase n=1 Tax=Halopseudomonas laoshanensis TaxID=2268758 RepID=A0A7V7KYM6_9GAMM|nr:FMN-dependent NADH-azoreductase [Halopseudomonas laoshanensis]KAA0696359.1 FMN-dependent NADH-azoreductase [Halopseudomonas laoshanensis]WOD09829.1 FMN-dependent NADH-azoreductase [Pseudomonas sp. NyZ704]
MNHILVINSSALGEASVSRHLVGSTVQRMLELNPNAVVTYRDLNDAPVPHLTSATVAGIRAVAQTQDELAAQALSDELIAELKAADVLVIGAPMYNFSIPSSLRSWFDYVLRPRVTFAYGAGGVQGLLSSDMRVIVIESRGGLYSEGPTKAMDFQEPYLRTLLGFIGITDVTFIHAERIGSGPEARELAIETAKSRIEEVVTVSGR